MACLKDNQEQVKRGFQKPAPDLLTKKLLEVLVGYDVMIVWVFINHYEQLIQNQDS